MKNVSCEYNRLNDWNLTLQAAWYIKHVRWACSFYVSFIVWWLCHNWKDWAGVSFFLIADLFLFFRGTEYQQLYRRCNSQTPYYKWNISQARPMNASDVTRSLQCWVSTTHRLYSQPTFFIFFVKSTNAWSRPHEVADVTRNFGGVTTAIYSYVIPVANRRLLEGETNL